MNWEYHIEEVPSYFNSINGCICEGDISIERLNELGSKGWELAAIQSNKAVFKRAIEGKNV